MDEHVNNSVPKLRQKAEATQQELADAVGVTRQTISPWKRGTILPRSPWLLKSLDFLKNALKTFLLSPMNDRLQEIGVALILLILVLFAYNPFHLWMPPAVVMMMATALVVVFGLFVALVWREKIHDEREHLHRLLAARLGFISGIAVLVGAIVIQTWQHDVDGWLPLAFTVMVLTKIAGYAYSRRYH